VTVPSGNFALENEVAAFTAVQPSLRRIANGDLAKLQSKLNSQPTRLDSYSQSAAYYAMTGRNGLWLYSNDDTFILIAAHPNSNNHLLLFPPMGKQPVRLLERLMNDERIVADHVQLARMAGHDQLMLAWAQATGQFSSTPEELLDWKFPVHTLSTHELIDHRGGRFRDFRKNILRAQRDGLSARLVEGPDDRATMSKLVGIWA